ncbi:MAG TPA: hypothetical protein VLT47_11100 [Anaeromyxobacteraceae bacterium]|nr:hypothetical protein [Anaeromyxobacteraceae bacterium]
MYVVKWTFGGDDPYLVDAGPPDHPTGQWGMKKGARRFGSKEEVRAHLKENECDGWLDSGRVKIVRLMPRKAAP